ncbi:ribonuclease HII [Brevibacterium album]|uniref:ribonuclease HII n=1 Tax=Brevibacterium album TaxID=417948 RepID=UPI00040510B5|nr:ribonuclease HII [Brevibacterium album]
MTAKRRPAEGIRTLETEAEAAFSGVRALIGMDEVGRGSLAGPVGVGAVRWAVAEALAPAVGQDAGGPALEGELMQIPEGLRDSKQVPAGRRTALAEAVARWRPQHAVAYASAAEIDAVGITLALSLAGRRALAALAVHGPADLVLLDGSHDWLSAPLTLDAALVFGDAAEIEVPPVRTFVKGDGRIATIAAASILAKTDRDARMRGLDAEFPGYGWASNAGYGSAAHREAIAALGVSPHHRTSWSLGV